MVCEMAQDVIEKGYPKTVHPQKARVMARSAAQSKVPAKEKIHKNTQKGFNTPAVPRYRFEEGTLYDVFDSHKLLTGAEYAGYEIIGHLILYCFLSGGHPYKFSEPALRMYGKVTESATGGEVLPGTGALHKAGAKRGAV